MSGAERRALEHLAKVVGVVFLETYGAGRAQRRRHYRSCASDDDVCPLFQKRDVGMSYGHADDALGRVELILCQRAATIQPFDHVTEADPLPHVVLCHPNRNIPR